LAGRPLCIHAVNVDAHDVGLLRDAGATVAHCPLANEWLGHGTAPVAAFRDAGIPVGVGTDSAAGNDQLRVLCEARAAADQRLNARGRLALATRDGARALGLSDTIGTLAPRMMADMAAFPIRDLALCDNDPELYAVEHCADVAARM